MNSDLAMIDMFPIRPLDLETIDMSEIRLLGTRKSPRKKNVENIAINEKEMEEECNDRLQMSKYIKKELFAQFTPFELKTSHVQGGSHMVRGKKGVFKVLNKLKLLKILEHSEQMWPYSYNMVNIMELVNEKCRK